MIVWGYKYLKILLSCIFKICVVYGCYKLFISVYFGEKIRVRFFLEFLEEGWRVEIMSEFVAGWRGGEDGICEGFEFFLRGVFFGLGVGGSDCFCVFFFVFVYRVFIFCSM